jgi:hypothetical protein
MALTPEVETAITELREAYPDATLTAVEDGQGGVYVTIDPVDLGEQYEPRESWIKFQITFQYPASDVYPHFIRPDVRLVAGPPANGTPLGEGSAQGQFAGGGQPEPAIQLSRRSNHLNPATDTAALKLEKVLAWLRRPR